MVTSTSIFSGVNNSGWKSIILLIVTAGSALSCACIQRYKAKKRLEKAPPGSLGLFGIGELLQFFLSPQKFDLHRMKKYGLNYTTHLFFAPHVRIGTVEDRLRIQRGEMKGELIACWPDHISRMLGSESVTLVTGTKHKFLRNLFQSTFSPETVTNYTKLIEDAVINGMERFNDGQTHSTTDFKSITLDILMRTAFGSDIPVDVVKILATNLQEWLNGFLSLIPYEVPLSQFKRSMDAKRAVIRAILPMIENCKPNSSDLLSRIVFYRDETGKGLSNAAIIDNIFILLVAGHDTTYASMCTIISLIFNPQNRRVLEKLRQLAKDSQTFEQWRQLEYVNAVMDEAWRHVTPINSLIRKSIMDIELSDGSIIPKGTALSCYSAAAHLQDEIWGPDNFDPERIIRVRKEKPDVFRTHYAVFGSGNRACLGEQFARAEVKMFLYLIARNYEITISKYTPVSFPMNRIECSFTLSRITSA